MCDRGELSEEVRLDILSYMFYSGGDRVLSREGHANDDPEVFDLEIYLV